MKCLLNNFLVDFNSKKNYFLNISNVNEFFKIKNFFKFFYLNLFEFLFKLFIMT